MNRDELLINGEAVDMAGASVSLEYVNNLLTGIENISASHSYTITLPATSRNERIFDIPENVARRSEIVGTYLDAEYRRRGIAIIKNAKAYISGIDAGKISVCLLWDGLSRFTAWKDANPELSALSYPEFSWTGAASSYAARFNDVAQAVYNTGVSASLMPAPPSVNFHGVLGKIMANFTDDWSAPASVLSEARRLFMPLCKRGGNRQPVEGGVWSRIICAGTTYYVSAPEEFRTYGTMIFAAGSSGADVSRFSALEISVNLSMLPFDAEEPALEVYGRRGENNTRLASFAGVLTDGRFYYSGSAVLDVSNFDNVFLRVTGVERGGPLDGLFSVIPTTITAVVGEMFDVASNLPAISQIDFIKAFCVLFGVQLVNQPDGSLVFASVDQVYARRSEAWDISDKIANFGRTPQDVKFTVSNYAQRNWIRYADDKTNNGLGSSVCFTVANVALALDKEVAKLPFAVTASDIVAHYEEKDGTVEDVEVTPRILCAYQTAAGKLGIAWDYTLEAGNILAKWYAGLQKMLEYPVTLKAYARLDEMDLAALDWVRPVYLRQTGRFYIIGKISTDATSDVCELELYQL